MTPVIFLDIDGVLNRHNFDPIAESNLIERDLVQNLNKVLIETKASIVLSSAWRYIIHRNESNLKGMDWLLRSHGMVGRRLIGVTRIDTMDQNGPVPNERGQQIKDWLFENGIRPYVVIDDGGENPDGSWSHLGLINHPVVWTNPKIGLTEANAQKAIEWLK